MDERESHMRRAIALAELGAGRVSPNPMVGAVLVRDGQVIGEGFHEGPGLAHAEVAALAAADDARGATLYCTLEPCDHFGRTPPCTKAIIEAGIARVVVAASDPNPAVDGRGIAALRAAGIRVDTDILAEEAERMNEAFNRHIVSGLPFVTLKSAASLDGKTAARDGSSKWITGEAAREDVHALRARSDAILVGAGTVIADDPSLTVRDPGYSGAPVLRVIADASGRVGGDARVFDRQAPTLVAATGTTPEARIREWKEAGAEVVICDNAPTGGVSLIELTAHLGKRDVQGLLIEGGATLASSAVRDGIVDKVVLYLAPSLIGGSGAPGILGGEGSAALSDATPMKIAGVTRVGKDLKVEAYVHRDS